MNSGFTPTLEFTRGNDGQNKITLTEKSSKRLAHHAAMGSCPGEWCNSDAAVVIHRQGRIDQAVATAGSLTMRSSLKGAIVSRLM